MMGIVVPAVPHKLFVLEDNKEEIQGIDLLSSKSLSLLHVKCYLDDSGGSRSQK